MLLNSVAQPAATQNCRVVEQNAKIMTSSVLFSSKKWHQQFSVGKISLVYSNLGVFGPKIPGRKSKRTLLFGHFFYILLQARYIVEGIQQHVLKCHKAFFFQIIFADLECLYHMPLQTDLNQQGYQCVT